VAGDVPYNSNLPVTAKILLAGSMKLSIVKPGLVGIPFNIISILLRNGLSTVPAASFPALTQI
jgi:hypothetical protein